MLCRSLLGVLGWGWCRCFLRVLRYCLSFCCFAGFQVCGVNFVAVLAATIFGRAVELVEWLGSLADAANLVGAIWAFCDHSWVLGLRQILDVLSCGWGVVLGGGCLLGCHVRIPQKVVLFRSLEISDLMPTIEGPLGVTTAGPGGFRGNSKKFQTPDFTRVKNEKTPENHVVSGR